MVTAHTAWYIVVILHSVCSSSETVWVIYIYIFIYSKEFPLIDSQLSNCLQMSTAIFLTETVPVNSREMYWILTVHQRFRASLPAAAFLLTSTCCRHILAYVVTPLPKITKVLFNNKTEKAPPTRPLLHWVKITITQWTNFWACDFARCKCCTGLQPSSSITAQIFPWDSSFS